jgi:hypothetical protein
MESKNAEVFAAGRDVPALTLEAMLDGVRHTWPVDLRESVPSGQVLRFSLRGR